MKKFPVLKFLICAVIYLALFVLGAFCGMIHPACYAYVGTFLPLLFGFIYLYCAANWRHFGVAAILNGFVLVLGLVAGEGNSAFIIGMIASAVLSEIFRAVCGYDTAKGVRLGFIPFAFSFYSYVGHWWTDKEGTLEAAIEEMSAEYAVKVESVIDNVPVLIIMLMLTIPVAYLGIRIASASMKKQSSLLK